ncbi:MAG: tetrapyrrole methylase [Selenomonadaceae bacterium]|nr:tetrapyrrole methylase [Selenomonadaceae bacterium]MBQ1915480.1 tetrapyrrole methylase [Selenomonadaceae bacterium]MBQ3970573.1 tetrapyrrole methylase [Selenomonadaceae bacterium]
MAGIKVVGLGPGRFGLITLEAWEAMKGAGHLLLRTAVHPTVEDIKARGIRADSYDEFYEDAGDFASLYQRIAEDLIHRAQTGEDIVYAVPGSPLVAERTVVLLREMAKEAKVALEILPGMSFLDIMYTRLCMDPVEGLAIVDASDLDRLVHCSDFPLLVTQVYDRHVASDAKIMLLELLPDEYEIIYAHNLALPDESIRRIPLFELDRQPDLDHLTSLFIPRYIESA